MIVTEKQARGKICPQTLARGPVPYTGNHTLETCVGSSCMAWHWKLNVDIATEDWSHNDDRSLGFCGLVGRP